MSRKLLPLAFCLSLALCPATTAQGAPDVIEAILVEGKENSQVWKTLTYLSEEIGPRLTGSTNLQRANAWTRDEFRRIGLKNAHLFKWGEIAARFDRGPSYARVIAPVQTELEFTAPSWSPGTDGPVSAPIRLRPESMAELEEIGWDYEGAWVLCEPTRRRGGRRRQESEEDKARREEQQAIDEALAELEILGRLTSTGSELVHTSSVRGWRDLDLDELETALDVRIRKSDYEALVEELFKGEEVVVEVDLAHHFLEGPFGVYNTVAEIPGTEKPEEVLIFSGHLDSWDGPGTQAAQDNGTGCAVMLEAARILMAAGVKPKRTIRFILWTGEEQGLFGSFGYVAALSEEERAGISACFVDDGGTGYQGGVNCVASQKEMLDAAMAPLAAAFPDFPVENTVHERMPRGGGSDHMPFNQVGIPGFFWKESGLTGREGKSYNFIHHTQHDTLRYAVEENLVQAATCSAIVAYQLAQAETLLPRYVEVPEEEAPPDPTFELTRGPFSGEWVVAPTGPESPDIELTLVLEHSTDGRLRGTMTGMAGSSPLRKGVFDSETGKATFRAVTDFGQVGFEVTVEQDRMQGVLMVMGTDMPFEGERTDAGEAQVAAAVAAGVSSKVGSDFPLTGRWIGYIESMDSEFTLTLAEEGGLISGRFQSTQSDSELHDVEWDPADKTLAFEYDYPHAGRLPLVAHLEGEELIGKIGENAEFVATRAEPVEPGEPVDKEAIDAAASDFPLVGRWIGYIESMDAEFTLTLEAEANVISGRFESSQSDSELHDVKWDPKTKTLEFEYDYPHAGRLPLVAQLEGAELIGKIGENAEFVAVRAGSD